MPKIDLIVTRHEALIELGLERGILDPNTEMIKHLDVSTPEARTASITRLKGKHVFGVLPLDLAAYCSRVTIIPLNLRPEDRGKELSLDETRERAGKTQTFVVQEIGFA